MLYVNDDNTDDLFRRAAEDYPLNTGTPDWNGLLGKLDDQDSGPRGIIARPKPTRSFSGLFFILLLLIPLEIIELRRVDQKITNESLRQGNMQPATMQDVSKDAARTSDQPANIEKSSQPVTAANQEPSGTTPAAGQDSRPSEASTTRKENVGSNSGQTKKQSASAFQSNRHTSTLDDNSRNSAALTDPATTTTGYAIAPASGNKKSDTSGDNNFLSGNPHKEKTRLPDLADNRRAITIAGSKAGAGSDSILQTVEVNPVAGDLQLPPTTPVVGAGDAASHTATAIPAASDSSGTVAENQLPPSPKKLTRKANFYIGLMGGIDVSSIKFQDIKKAGFSGGVLLGYRISRKFRIETGLMRDRKYYATDGKYFNPKEPIYTTVEYANGYCNMWEIPVNLLYTFRSTAKASWSASVGSSSYLMRNESYVLNLNNNGVRYPHQFDYQNKSTNVFSVINLSAVYSRKLGSIGELRLEPYLRLPVSRIGTGNMHVQSGGLMVGLTRTIF